MTERKIERPKLSVKERADAARSYMKIAGDLDVLEMQRRTRLYPKLVAALREAQETIIELGDNGVISLNQQGWEEWTRRDALLRSLEQPGAKEEEPQP